VTPLRAIALFVAGILAWGNLKQELLPNVSFPVVTVVAPYPGAGATDVTEQVAKPIEQSVSGVPGLSQLRSTSANSFAFVVAEFDYGTDVDAAMAEIEENLRQAALPNGVEPTVGAFDFNAAPVVVASVAGIGSTDLEGAAEIARNEIIPELESIPGVASAEIAGGLEDRLVIALDPARMTEAGVSMQQVIGVVQANNITIPGGALPTDEARIPVSTIGRFDSVEEIESLVVGVKLGHVEGLGDQFGAQVAGAAARGRVGKGREEDGRQRIALRAQGLEDLETAGAGHAHVGDHQVGGGDDGPGTAAAGEPDEGVVAAGELDHRVSVAAQLGAEEAAHLGVVFDEQDQGGHASAPGPGIGPGGVRAGVRETRAHAAGPFTRGSRSALARWRGGARDPPAWRRRLRRAG
jgi:HAE1 family hydrophobic/amphiphilic exporter-1